MRVLKISAVAVVKKKYQIIVHERAVNERGKTTSKSVNRASFIIDDEVGDTDIHAIKNDLMLGFC